LAYEFFEYRKNDLIRQPAQAVESPLCKIVDIHTDTDFIVDSGCFARNLVVSKGMKSLCIPTSSVYANWECLSYNKASDMFIVFYGQAFAD